jgi:restriction system protein
VKGNERIDSRYLRRFPEFVEFQRGDDSGQTSGEKSSEVNATAETTPEELIETGYRQVQAALASDLLDRVKSGSPAFFERLVVELLVSMGYGGHLRKPARQSANPVTKVSTALSRKTVSVWT